MLSKKNNQIKNIGFSKFFAFKWFAPKWCVLVGSKKTQSVYVCNAHQNALLLDDVMDWGLTYKDLIKKIVYKPESNIASCIGMNPVLALQL